MAPSNSTSNRRSARFQDSSDGGIEVDSENHVRVSASNHNTGPSRLVDFDTSSVFDPYTTEQEDAELEPMLEPDDSDDDDDDDDKKYFNPNRVYNIPTHEGVLKNNVHQIPGMYITTIVYAPYSNCYVATL